MDFDLSSSRNQEELPMQKNYVQEILSIIHSGLPKAELAEKQIGRASCRERV